MSAKNHIKKMVEKKDIKKKDIAKKLEMPPQSLVNLISRDKMTFQKAEEIADACGCDVVFLDRLTGEVF